MKILPAIDLIDGRCVRLAQGDFDRATQYAADPADALARFADDGAEEVHIVDLDGAREGRPVQHALLRRLAADARVAVQVAGGVRGAAHVAALLDAGAARVVVGTLALKKPEVFEGLLDAHGPERLVLALDVRVDAAGAVTVASHGWRDAEAAGVDDVLSRHPRLRHLLVTDIGRDGMLAGPNLPLMERLTAGWPHIALQASGGVGSLADLPALARTGAARAIVGKAIWEGRFNAAEAIRHARG